MQLSAEDEELLAEFLAESREGLAAVEGYLVIIESNPQAKSELEATFRCLHTIKGSAGYFGLDSIKSVAHALENLLDKMRSGALVADATSSEILLDGTDLIVTLIEDTESKRGDRFREGEVLALVESVRSLLSGGGENPHASQFHQTLQRLRENPKIDNDLESNLEQLAKLAEKLVPTVTNDKSKTIPPVAANPNHDSDKKAAPEPSAAPVATERAKTQAPASSSKRPANAEQSEAQAAVVEAQAGSDKTMRVPERRVDDFLSYVGSLVRLRQVITSVEKRMNSSVADLGLLSEVRTMASSFIKVSEELQRSVMSLRLVPVSIILRKVPRLVRDVAVARGKQIQVQLEGESLEIDKSLVEVLEGPIIHMVRNAADHGIETPAARESAGKKPTGTVLVRVIESSDELRVEICDDGGGIHRDKLRGKAIAMGLIGANDALSDDDIISLLFAPGISTADEVTDISGRGVGMDVVKRNVEQRGGVIKVTTEVGKGSTFSVSLPKTVATAITPAITVRSAGMVFAVPLLSISEIVLLEPGDSTAVERTPDGHVLRLRDQVIPLISLQEALHREAIIDSERGRTVILFDTEIGTVGVRVDQVFDSLDVVVQEVAYLARRGLQFSEACVLGDGSIALIVNSETIVSCLPKSEAMSVQAQRKEPRTVARVAKTLDRFLVVALSDGRRQVLPMQSVVRIETIHPRELERVGSRLCVQYRGRLLHAAAPPGHTLQKNEPLAMVVLSKGEETFGLFVAEILDILESVVLDRRKVGRNGVASALMIDDVAYEEIDLSSVFQSMSSTLKIAA